MSAIGPGDWVICVSVTAWPGYSWAPGDHLTEGALYQVADCWVDDDGYPVLSIIGRERVHASRDLGFRAGFCVKRFRPAFGPKQSLIEQLSAPAPSVMEPA